MKNKETVFVCSNCGNEFSKWMGQCSACGEWNTLKEIKISNAKFPISKKRGLGEKLEVKNLAVLRQDFGSVNKDQGVFSTGIYEFDRVLGKGIVQGSAVLFAGEPGIGKSTLLTQLIGKIGGLYVAGEESSEQIGLRVKRLGLEAKNFDILGTNSIDELDEFLNRTQNVYKIAVVDSIQVMASENASGVVGSVGQIKESAFRLIQLAKKKGVAIFIVGHVTKEGDIAGPKLLEHMVDTVLYFEGEKNGDLRILRTTKNRFGATDEVGVFKMEEKGL
ncbi:MAG: ATPase domain-containing protein, partial [Candidatus Shapirobacteria bacterium]|nr:ATPase domain-containing protein [Candidatus Shapirobacteria bacterium]